MSIYTVTTRISRRWLERKTKSELASIIMANIDSIELFKDECWQSKEAVSELVRQMRERASFANTPAALSRLISTWADVLEGKSDVGWAAINREDLKEAKACLEFTAITCGPSKCEHVWGMDALINGPCPDCKGSGVRDTPRSRITPTGSDKCFACFGTGEIENGGTRVCSKCGVSAFELSLWE